MVFSEAEPDDKDHARGKQEDYYELSKPAREECGFSAIPASWCVQTHRVDGVSIRIGGLEADGFGCDGVSGDYQRGVMADLGHVYHILTSDGEE